MFDVFYDHPGLLFVVATLLPIASFLLLAPAGQKARRGRFVPTIGQESWLVDALPLHNLLGGEVTGARVPLTSPSAPSRWRSCSA